ncbi:MAG: hypothetical protein IIW36_01855 [Clostridia bacterium]|nr:hypothetical protein [Clostridia bacterium]
MLQALASENEEKTAVLRFLKLKNAGGSIVLKALAFKNAGSSIILQALTFKNAGSSIILQVLTFKNAGKAFILRLFLPFKHNLCNYYNTNDADCQSIFSKKFGFSGFFIAAAAKSPRST